MLLHPKQKIIARDTHRFRVLRCGRRFGKALALNTPILTSEGYKNLIDVRVGDFVYDEKGEPVEVLYKSEIYFNRRCFKVSFSDGESIIADADHDWLVEDKSYRKNLPRSGKVKKVKKTTLELKNTLRYNAKENNYSIPLADAIKHSEKELPIEPYFLGLWLGDGCSANCGITTVDKEIIDYLYDYAKRLGCKVRKEGITYFITGDTSKKSRDNSLQSKLRLLGVIQNKKIPEIYKIASPSQRMELLMGLMDSDGYAGRKCNEYTTVSKTLADDIYELLASLGIKSVVHEYDEKLYGRIIGKKYRINFNTNTSVFKLKRKKEKQKKVIREWVKRRYIVDIQEVDSVPVQCLMVDSDSHLFLAGRGLVATHNTTLLVEEIKGMAVARPSRIAYIAKNYQQARDIAWDLLKKELEGAILSVNEARLEMRVKTVDGKESIIFLRGWESVENLLGQSFDLLCIDEVAYMENFWVGWENVLRPTLLDRKGIAIFASTPNGFNHFYDLCNKELTDIDFKTFHFKTSDNPFIPKEEIERLKETLPPEVFAQEHDAEFVKKSGLVYKEFDRERHLYDELPQECYSWDYIAGVDFGYRNPTAVLHIYTNGETFYVEDEWYKTERTDAQVAEYVASYSFRAVYPDPESPGGIEELRRRRVNTREVKKGKGTIEEGIQKIRELLLSGRLKVNRKCVNLISEFEMYSYDETTSGKSIKETPVAAFNHGLDALRYVVLTYKPIGEILKKQSEFWQRNRNNNLNTTR